MGNDTIAVLLILIFAVIVLVFVKIIEFLVRFNNDTRYIAGKMQRAGDYDEYRYWRGELRCHYLCLIPFVNKKNVMRLYNRIYHKPEYEKTEKRSDGLYHILAPSVVGMCICAVCLCGASWAWFTSTQTSNVANIQTATYTVSVTAKKDDTDISVTENNNGVFEIRLEAESEYTITLTAGGNAKSGYCKTEFRGATYYTPQIAPSNVFTFKVKANNAGVLKITPQWGTYTGTDNIIEAETTLELGTVSVSDNNDPENTNAAATTQVTPATPENTMPVADTDTKTTAPADTDEQSSDNNNTEQEQKSEQEQEPEQEQKPEETTETNSESEY